MHGTREYLVDKPDEVRTVLLAKVWGTIPWFLQRIIFWMLNPKVVVGVSGVVLDEQDRILLLKHRFHHRYPWGLPGGWVNRGEPPMEALVRELQEETNLQVAVDGVLEVGRSFPGLLEVFFVARIVGGEMKLDRREILDAGFFGPGELPDSLHHEHVGLIRRALQHTADVGEEAERVLSGLAGRDVVKNRASEPSPPA
jgi:8-oxo-dGTP diphosphatase